LLGVNNRNLHDFTVDLQTTGRLRKCIPANIALVAESGIHTAEDVARVKDMGVDAILIGEALVTANDVSAKVRELVTK
jgi:indole-3-glycerol phosphate synthase